MGTKRKALTKKEQQAVYDKYDGHCAYCGKKIEYKDMQVDHRVAIMHCGEDEMDNYMPACRRCNHYKRAASVEGFRMMIEEIPIKLMRDSYIYKVAADYGFVPTEEQEIEFYFEKIEKQKREDDSSGVAD